MKSIYQPDDDQITSCDFPCGGPHVGGVENPRLDSAAAYLRPELGGWKTRAGKDEVTEEMEKRGSIYGGWEIPNRKL